MEKLIITPTTVIDFKPARPEDLPLVMAILAEAAAWLQTKGIDQWPSPPPEHWHKRMAAKIARSEMFTVGIGNNRFGIVGLNWADSYWPDDEQAGYVHRMAIRSLMHGQNLGDQILFWAQQRSNSEDGRFYGLIVRRGTADCAVITKRRDSFTRAQSLTMIM